MACLALLSAGCAARRARSDAAILLFEGRGTSPNDVAAVESVLEEAGLAYSTADSADLNGMGGAQLRRYRLLIVPGGNFVEIGNHLTPRTTTTIRDAVGNGLHYLGICAGAFFAGNSPYNGLNLTSGVRFGFYSAEERGIRKTAVAITGPASPTLDQYWEDGPQLSGWGDVVARYPDGTPAVVEASVGSGWAILSGFHPEAPASWRRGISFHTPIAEDRAYARRLIESALTGVPLPHF